MTEVSICSRLARLLRDLARSPGLLREPETAAPLLGGLGGGCDPARFAGWQARWTKPAAGTPMLLHVAGAARDWLESGIQDLPSSLAALAASAGLLTQAGALQTVLLFVWSAGPALAAADTGTLPRLRGDAAARLYPGAPPPWELVFLAIVAEAARAGLQELDRLQTAAAAGAKLAAGLDLRSRLPAAVNAVLREPAVTPRSLARVLRITPQAALRLLASLQRAGLVWETTGRRSFRAFTVGGPSQRPSGSAVKLGLVRALGRKPESTKASSGRLISADPGPTKKARKHLKQAGTITCLRIGTVCWHARKAAFVKDGMPACTLSSSQVRKAAPARPRWPLILR